MEIVVQNMKIDFCENVRYSSFWPDSAAKPVLGRFLSLLQRKRKGNEGLRLQRALFVKAVVILRFPSASAEKHIG